MVVLETERLRLRRLAAEDAGFIVRLLTEPSFIRYIGDKGVRNEEAARVYIEGGPAASWEKNGFGLDLVELKETGAPMGICGLIRRENLPNADIGYAFLPEYWGQGYALEAASAVLSQAREVHGLDRVLAVTNVDNESSIRLLEKLGFRYFGMLRMADGEPEAKVFASEAGGPEGTGR